MCSFALRPRARDKRMSSNSLAAVRPPIFAGENYHILAIKMKAFLKAQSLWELLVEDDVGPPALRVNPTLTQLKKYKEDLAKKSKASTCLHSALSNAVFTRIMACETPNEVWDKLRDKFTRWKQSNYWHWRESLRSWEWEMEKPSRTIPPSFLTLSIK